MTRQGPLGPTLKFSHAAMATVFEVHCVHADERYAGQAAQAAFAVVDRLEQEQSRFVANSDVARINELGSGQATRVSPSTMECLELAVAMHALTLGAFDVSIGTGLERLELLPLEFVVRAHGAGARLDLGGIGKGYAVDRMAETLDEWELRHALLHGGFSSVLAREAPPDQDGWPLTLSAPGSADAAVLARLSARRLALSASGTRKGAHIRDPRSGDTIRDRTAWVAVSQDQAPRCAAAVAEALSTAFMILPVEQVERLCREPGVEAWLIREPGAKGAGPALVHLPGGAEVG